MKIDDPWPRSAVSRFAAAFLLVLACSRAASGQAPPPPEAAPPVATLYSADQLDQLLSPIALYPDPLIALILPASTSPGDIVAAASYLQANGDPNGAQHGPWSDSVKGLVHYPPVVEWMAQNLMWTQALGAAVNFQSDAVIQSIQRLRTRALAVGALVDSPEQQVVEEDDLIEILPAAPDFIYVPRYDPQIVYVGGYYDGPYLTFGEPYPIGGWLTYGLDWRRRALWVGDGRVSRDSRGWQRPNFMGATGHAWRPAAVPSKSEIGPSIHVIRPNPMPGMLPPRRPASNPGQEPRDRKVPSGASAQQHVQGQSASVVPNQAPRPRPTLPSQATGLSTASTGARPASPQPGQPARPPSREVSRGTPANQQARPAAAPPRQANPPANRPPPSNSSANDQKDRDKQQQTPPH